MSEIDKNLKIYEKPVFINALLLILNTALFVLKLIFGIITNSLALQADAFDNMTDIITCLIAFIGILFSKKKPNEKFPFGYYKLENIVSLIISLFIFVTALTIIYQSFSEILYFYSGNPKKIYFSPYIFLFLIFSMLISLILTLYLRLIYKKTNSPVIKSEANEKAYDIFISLSVLIGFIGALLNFYLLDSIIALFIAIFIIKGGYDIFLTSTKTLLDAVIDFDNRTELLNLIKNTPAIKEIDNLEIRSYGRYIFLELEIALSRSFPLSQINFLKNKLSNDIMKEFPLIFKTIIIIRSQEKTITKVAVPLVSSQGLNSEISTHYGESPYFGILEFEDNKFLKYKIIINEFAHEEKRKGILVSDWLIQKKIDKIYLKKELKKGPSLVFNSNFIDLKLTDLKNLNEIIEKEKEQLKSI
ncbi:MAG: cation diffusion facilitator family transporter [Promethearchaeota archaeon]